MKIFFDFDDTLFHTSYILGGFTHDLRGVFTQGGWTREQIAEFRQAFSGSAFDAGKLYHYKHHLALLEEKYPKGTSDQTLLSTKSFMKDLRQYLFPDVIPALELLGKENIVLLTYGDRDFQNEKIVGSGIAAYVSDIVITKGEKLGPLRDWLQKRYPNEKIEESWFIDDKQKYFKSEISLPKPKTVLMCRVGEEAILPETDYVVKDCLELVKKILHDS